MKMITKIISATAALVIAAQAQAGFMIEPFLGYEMSDYKVGSSKKDMTGTNFGLRVGGTTAIFSYGIEYAVGSNEVDTNPDIDVDTTDMGVFVAVDFPILLRAYATYFIKSKAEAGPVELEGNGTRIGVGYTGLPFISINFEKINRTYDEDQHGSISPKNKTDGYLLSVSLPLP